MVTLRPLSLVLTTGLLLSQAFCPIAVLARGGGGGGGGWGGGGGGWGGAGAGGHSWGGGDYHFQDGGWQGGYQGYHPMFGDGARSPWQGNRPANVNVYNNFYNRNYNGWNSSWSNGGYWGSRPWNAGWYGGWGGWGWWGGSAAAWGIAGLATGATITSLVNAAASNNSTVIVVPTTSYELNYGSVEAVGSYGVSFSYNVDGFSLMGAANCQQGLFNGQVPGTADQAQLLNAVCQVAYGSGR